MKSSMAWCLEPTYCEREYRPRLDNSVRKSGIKQNFERVCREAANLHTQGLSGAEIARRLGVSTDCVYRALRISGVRTKR